MSSKAAAAMYPYLAVKDVDLPRSERDRETNPTWATSNDPLWSEPRPVPKDYSKVPGLVKVSNRR
jgi:hypothetical protein